MPRRPKWSTSQAGAPLTVSRTVTYSMKDKPGLTTLRTLMLKFAVILAKPGRLWKPGSFLFAGLLVACLAAAQEPVTVHIEQGRVEIANGLVRAVFTETAASVTQEFFANRNGTWVRVAEAFHPPRPRPTQTTELYLNRSNEHGRALGLADEYRMLVPPALTSVRVVEQHPDEARLLLSGNAAMAHVEQFVTLRRGQEVIHFDVRGSVRGEPPRLEYLFSPFEFAVEGTPEFSHAPSYKRSPGDVIGDRAFFAPAAIVQQGTVFAALVPDLSQINDFPVYGKNARGQKHRWIFGVPIDSSRISMPAVLDLELVSGMGNHPLLAYGIMDVITEQHVFWRHENAGGTLVRTLSGSEVRYGMDLLISATAASHQGYRRVAAHLWDRYGQEYIQKPRPQAMPFAKYAEELYPASFDYKGFTVEHPGGMPTMVHREENLPDTWNSWQQWEQHGVPLGALRLTAPQWFHLAYNTAWWNNVADATGLFWWGQQLGDSLLTDKARRIVNFSLTAPQQRGLFPSLYDLNKGTWVRSLWRFPTEGYDPDQRRTYWNWEDGDYQTASASVTAGYLMEVYRLYQKDPRILEFVEGYGRFLIDHMQPDGSVPAWFDENLDPRPSMRWNADGGAHAWVLAELYRATGDAEYLAFAERIAQFVMEEVLPGQRWVDFEALYSCAVKEETFHDARTGQPPRNAMSMSWALQGFVSLYEATGEERYLEAAESVADYASFLQTVWAPHYVITAYPFGGFSSQIGDAEWLDQRDHRFAGIYVRLGLLAGRQDLLERGVAAARSSLALITHPRHVSNGIYNVPTFPFGLGPENIDHEGFPQTPLRSGPSWAEVGGLVAAADVLRELGSVYVNVEQDLAVGVDGVYVEGFSRSGRTLSIHIDRQLAELPVPFAEPYMAELRVEGLPDDGMYTLVFGGEAPREVTAAELASYAVVIR